MEIERNAFVEVAFVSPYTTPPTKKDTIKGPIGSLHCIQGHISAESRDQFFSDISLKK